MPFYHFTILFFLQAPLRRIIIKKRNGGFFMQVTLSRKARNQYDKLNEPVKSRIKAALNDLSENPPQGDIKSLEGRDGFRARVGSYRILFDNMASVITIYSIEPRGSAYKGR
jgi:mRNA interferase RelE/StbE